MLLAAYLSTAFIVGGTGALHLLRDATLPASRIMFSMAMWMAALVAPLQIVAGDFHGLNTLEHQPAKVAAMEGHFETHAGAPLILFGWPDMEQERTRYAVEVPKLGSLILTHDWNGTVRGLKEWPREDRPNAAIVFWSFRVMVGAGLAMLAIGMWSLALRVRRRLYDQPWLLRASVALSPIGIVAVIAGWITTEVGRQPYTVYGLLRTAESASSIDAAAVGASLAAFAIVYFAVFGAGAFYMLRLMSKPPELSGPEFDAGPSDACKRPHARTGHGQGAARMMHLDLALIWAGLLAFAVLAYVVLDGFDLGVGILFPFMPEEKQRDEMMNSVAPVWDGNETWLVLGGGGLFAVFPLAYAIIMPALYAPVIALLLGLVFRGVAFEFRWKTQRGKFLWDGAFAAGSTLAAFSQGIALGALVQGIPVAGRAYAGGWWDWLTPFSLLTGVALVFGYALLGATWLIYKTQGQTQQRAYRFATIAAGATLAAIGIVSLWTPFLSDVFMQRWFSWPRILFVTPVPALVALAAYVLFNGLRRRHELSPFLASLALFVLCFIGLLISFFPYLVPTSVTLWEAAAPPSSLEFLLAGAAFLIPIILVYTAYSYWVFRGKIEPGGGGYH